jgi:hypothetical protein
MFGKNKRTHVSEASLDAAMNAVRAHLKAVLKKHGKGTFTSRAEALGVIQLEFDEYKLKVQARDKPGQCHELLDIAVACVFAHASDATMDW